MKVALVAMPWSIAERPSAALGALAAYVHREQPEIETRAIYEYVHVARRLGFTGYGLIANEFYIGDLLYMPLLFPEQRASVCDHFVEWARRQGRSPADFGGSDWSETFDRLQAIFRERIEAVVEDLAACRVVGMTTCFGQLFPNLALARRLRERAPDTRIVLGGSTVSARVGASVMEEFPWIDHVIQGEGERPFLAYVSAVAAGEAGAGGNARGDARGDDDELDAIRGVVARKHVAERPDGAEMWEMGSLDDLPMPDFSPYVELARQYGFDWRLPIEGSRGCWWDRTRRYGNPKSTCYFCNLNVQWNGYRQKSVERLVDEVKTLSEQYTNTQIYFLDNIIRHDGIEDMARGLSGLGKDLEYFYEMRANVHPYHLLLLWESGLRGIQVGVEGLCTSYLRRIGKGTTAIQNLQVMKTCAELGISNASANLITWFPGSTQEEVEETLHNIRTYALAYEPCNVARFALGVDSTVDKLREQFKVTNVRNKDWLRSGLPEELWQRMRLFDLSYDDAGDTADWGPVERACAGWRELWETTPRPLLFYFDGGTFLRIVDRRAGRSGAHPVRLLSARSRDIYLYCMEIRSFEDIAGRFGFESEEQQRKLRAFLQQLVQWGLMFAEKRSYLSLALASSPQAAARRLRAAHAQAERERGARPAKLRVISR